jgi:hypothetical protein
VIVGYDATNHALLVHFGSPRRGAPLQVEAWEMGYTPGRLTRVETAFDPDSQALVAIHFCPRGFFMPFFGSEADLLSRWRFSRAANEVRIDLAVVPRQHDPVWARPGVELFLSLPRRTGRDRPFLHGFRIHTLAQPLELNLEQMSIRVVPNSLESARADSFVEP